MQLFVLVFKKWKLMKKWEEEQAGCHVTQVMGEYRIEKLK